MTDLNAPPMRRRATVPPPTPGRVRRPVNEPMTTNAADANDGRQPTGRSASKPGPKPGPKPGSKPAPKPDPKHGPSAGSGGSGGSAGAVQLDAIAKLIIEQLQQD